MEVEVEVPERAVKWKRVVGGLEVTGAGGGSDMEGLVASVAGPLHTIGEGILAQNELLRPIAALAWRMEARYA
jgi:hypothetical protein